MNKILKNLRDKRILILGFGREGQSTLKFLRRYFPNKTVGIADQNKVKISDKYIKTHFGPTYLESLQSYEIIFKSPGIPNKLKEIKEARKNSKITSQTKLFFDLCKGIIVGITGTKGKSTTTTLIYRIAKKAGLRVVILGNIGKPCLDYLDKNFGKGKIFVFESSSHQLSDLTQSPHIAVFLNIFKEHMDYYESFKEYFEAKKNITRFQSENDFFVYNLSQELTRKAAGETKAQKLGFSIERLKDSSCFIEDGFIVLKTNRRVERLLSINHIPLLGEHNLNNVMAAVLAAKALGAPTRNIRQAVKNFKPLEHRLQKVGTFKGITFVDDSLATIPEATIAAIDAFKGKVGSLMLGGSDRGQDFSQLVRKIVGEKIPVLILFPTTGQRIWKEVVLEGKKKNFFPKHSFVDNMADAVRFSYEDTPKGKICLLSTASPSFTIFRDYEEKSVLFRKYVRMYAKS